MRGAVVLVALAIVGCSESGGGSGGETETPQDTGLPADGMSADSGGDDADAGVDEPLVTYTEDRAPCLDRNPTRNLYFGDLHVHTRLSFDAWVNDVRTTIDEAYAFARGETVRLPPLDEAGVGTREVGLARPLDFTAVTDHVELIAETQFCSDPESGPGGSDTCLDYRGTTGVTALGISLSAEDPKRIEDVCGDPPTLCTEAAQGLWTETQEMAEKWYDRSEACEFTTFVGYEYTASTTVTNLHRNVIFRNAEVPDAPTTYFDASTPQQLWQDLRTGCVDAEGGCDVLAIPHNSNWSNGQMFAFEYPGATTEAEQADQARLRIEMEPLVEIYQHKGDTECRVGLESGVGAPDEQCSFEKLRLDPVEDCGEGTGNGAMIGIGCLSRRDFVRNVLLEGLAEEARIGVNPYQLGIMAATDTHNGTPGAVRETDWPGHVGVTDGTPEGKLASGGILPGGLSDGPGGLMGVWAVENSRDALFEAMRRREVYGTSGPRIPVRLFAGWDVPADLCDREDFNEVGYASGVPMGGELSDAPAGAAPTLAVQAWADVGDADFVGTPLQRIQVIKGWLDGAGELHRTVYDVAGDPDNGASVDLATCDRAPGTGGFDRLCTVWNDPDFDASERAFYYVRVLENPTCRFATWVCNALAPDDQPSGCSNDDRPKTIQERAWTSPIWYQPPN